MTMATLQNSTSDTFDAPPLESLERSATSFSAVVDMLLKDQKRLNALLRDETTQRDLIPQLLAVALAGFAIYGVVATTVLNALWHTSGFWLPGVPASHWNAPSIANLTLAYSLGLIAANGVCLPSFYFYGLLAGVRISMVGIIAHALKGMAAGAVALVGILPVYFAIALSGVVFDVSEALMANLVLLGLGLPFLAGLWGATCLYNGFVDLADTIPRTQRRSRKCFLRRLILAWSGCYTFITPLMIYTLWSTLSKLL